MSCLGFIFIAVWCRSSVRKYVAPPEINTAVRKIALPHIVSENRKTKKNQRRTSLPVLADS